MRSRRRRANSAAPPAPSSKLFGSRLPPWLQGPGMTHFAHSARPARRLALRWCSGLSLDGKS
eukprot:2745028-Alexandrium_andersonii.AAC.1